MTAETTAFAPAKINLTLHVTGVRDDGYHLLDSLVAFAATGDRVTVREAEETRLTVTGPRAGGVPTDGSNLVLRAADLLPGPPVAITLEKHLPAAAGIGGGSADAAATLRALARLRGTAPPAPEEALRLGADVPACLVARPCRMSGIGEEIAEVPPLPPVWFVLANPGAPVATPEAFGALGRKDNASMPPELPHWPDAAAFARWLATQRNDLEDPARVLAPAVGVVLSRLAATEGCLLARMSGSGATCFGLYASAPEAEAAAASLRGMHAGWWITATGLHAA